MFTNYGNSVAFHRLFLPNKNFIARGKSSTHRSGAPENGKDWSLSPNLTRCINIYHEFCLTVLNLNVYIAQKHAKFFVEFNIAQFRSV